MALARIDPFSPTGGEAHQHHRIDLEGLQVPGANFLGYGFDGGDGAVMILQKFPHLGGPQAVLLEFPGQIAVHQGEFPAHVALHVEVLVGGFDAGVHTGDVGDGGGGGNGHGVRVAHAVALDMFAHRSPVQAAALLHIQEAPALGFENFQGVLGKDAPVPFAAGITLIGSPFLRQFRTGQYGMETHQFHGLIGEALGGGIVEAQPLEKEAVLKAHDAHSHGAMPEIGIPGLLGGVEIQIDHVIQHPNGGGDAVFQKGLAESRSAGFPIDDVPSQIDAAQIANGGFIFAVVQGDFGAQIRVVHHTRVILGAADIRRILEGNPGMAGFEEAGEHFAPQLHRFHPTEEGDASLQSLAFVVFVAFSEGRSVEMMKIRGFIRGEEGPHSFGLHPLHEEIGNPVGGVHVVGTTPVVSGVAPEIQEIFDIVMPGFQIGAGGPPALA